DALLGDASPGSVFASAVGALEQRQLERLNRLVALTDAASHARDGLTSAFGWVNRAELEGLVAALLVSPHPSRRQFGLAACALHGVDPGLISGRWHSDADPAVRARALRMCGELGRVDLLASCLAALAGEDIVCQF